MPEWIDKNEYPFLANFIDVPAGRLHYIDEGKGAPIVMVHGNPTWSFLYRHLIKGLSEKYRCIAMDHIGFGLSDKPADWTYLPEDHAKNLKLLIDTLDLEDITLIVQDWGGPTGLSYAVNNPGKIHCIVIMNTWMWPVAGVPHFERFSGFMGGTVGRFLIKYFNFFVRVVMKQAMGDSSRLTKPIHRHYLEPLAQSRDRKGCWVFPKQIIASSPWLETLWGEREKLKDIPALLMWGMKDIAFRKNELETWKNVFNTKKIYEFEGIGHFVQEEKGAELCPLIDSYLTEISS